MNGPNVFLRAPEPRDVNTLYEWENDPGIWHISNTLVPYSRFDIEQYVMTAGLDIFNTKQLRLMIDLKKANENLPIGAIDLFDFDPIHKRAGLGILILEKYRGKGLASEALEVFIDYAFNTLQLHQLYCNISSKNLVSQALFKKHGFKTIGLKKDWLSVPKGWVDEYLLQLINNS